MKATIDGGKGNDTIYNGVNEVSVNGGTGNDYIDNQFGFRLFGRSYRYGSDYVPPSNQISKPDNSTLIGGDGNDSIRLSSYAYNNLILYRAGDGDDTIVGFKSSSTLSIAGGYSSAKSGNDVIVSVGDEKITLVGAASLSSVKIENKVNPLLVVGTKSNDSMDNKSSGATVKALVGNNFIDNYGAKVSLFGGAGNDTISNKTSYTQTETRQVTRTKQVKEYDTKR